MIKVEKIDVWGFEHAIRGMRNPMNSWDKSDSDFKFNFDNELEFIVGKNDLDLMRRLYKAGTEHRKYLRQIFVSMDITAPLYWWKEFDTYKFVLPDPGHVDVNSCSTMHKIAAKRFELDDFSHEHLKEDSYQILNNVCEILNDWRYIYLNGSAWCEKHDKEVWWQMIQLLPSSYNQKRTVTFTYENVITMIRQRTGHKLDEWNDFVEILKGLPYVAEITEE